jgi:hypothetical protein
VAVAAERQKHLQLVVQEAALLANKAQVQQVRQGKAILVEQVATMLVLEVAALVQ